MVVSDSMTTEKSNKSSWNFIGARHMTTISWSQFLHLFDSAPFDSNTPEASSTCDRELRALLNIAFHFQPKRILELYTSEGYTALWLARMCQTSEVLAIDICSEMNIAKGQYNAPNEIKDRLRVGRAFLGRPEENRIRLIIKDPSEIAFSEFNKFDLIYIDGEHSFDAILSDTKRALDCSSSNGILVWDDYQAACPQVIEFLNKLSAAVGDTIIRIETSRLCFLMLTPSRHEALSTHIRKMFDGQPRFIAKFPKRQIGQGQ